MKKVSFIILPIILLIVGLTGCKSTNDIADSQSKDAIIVDEMMHSLAESYTAWNTYSVSGKISLSGKLSFSTSMQLKMVKDELITISVRPILGIEVAKVYINNDSAVVVNKLNKVYSSIPLSQFAQIVPTNLGTLQDALLSRVSSLADGTLANNNIKKFKGTYSDGTLDISPKKAEKNFQYIFNVTEKLQLSSLTILPTINNNIFTAKYHGYSRDRGGEASLITLDTHVSGKPLSVELSLNTSKAKWNDVINESISIGRNYKKVSLEQFISIIKSF